MFNKNVLIVLLGLLVTLPFTLKAQDEGVDCSELTEEEKLMYPFCDDIDAPLDSNLPVLIVATVGIAFYWHKRQAHALPQHAEVTD